MSDINIIVKDRGGRVHSIFAPTDMAMNLMEIIRSFELAPEGSIGVCGGMAMCASCQCYVESDHELATGPEPPREEGEALVPHRRERAA